MSLSNFVPTVWAARLLDNLDKSHVYANCLNRDYEGEIKQAGDTVKINSIGDITIGTYTPNSDISDPETLQDSQAMLAITELKYFNFQIDDVDKAQSNVDLMNKAMKRAAWGLADVADQYLAALLEADVATASKRTAATSCGTGASDDDAYEILVDLRVLLDENNVPSEDRWCVVPPWYHGLLLKDPRFVSFGTPENRANLRGKAIGEASQFDIWVSNNVPVSSGDYTVIAGCKEAATYAEQIPDGDVEAYRPQKRFADAVKGLHVYGAKVTRPYALASCVCTAA